MKVRKLIQKRLRHEGSGVNLAGDVNAAVSANVNEPGPSHTHVSSRQRVIQRSGRTRASEERETTERDFPTKEGR